MASAITYSLSSYPEHYSNDVLVILNPEDREVYTFGRVGAGIPGVVHSGEHYTLLTVSRAITAEALQSFLEGWEETLLELCQCTDRNERAEMIEGMQASFHDANLSDWLERAWDASDWIYGDISAVLNGIKAHECATLEAAADLELSNAHDSNALIDRDDMISALRSAIEDCVDDLEAVVQEMEGELERYGTDYDEDTIEDAEQELAQKCDELAFWKRLLA